MLFIFEIHVQIVCVVFLEMSLVEQVIKVIGM